MNELLVVALSNQLLGGPWEVISRVISRITMIRTYIRGLITPLITTHEPPSMQEIRKTKLLSKDSYFKRSMCTLSRLRGSHIGHGVGAFRL